MPCHDDVATKKERTVKSSTITTSQDSRDEMSNYNVVCRCKTRTSSAASERAWSLRPRTLSTLIQPTFFCGQSYLLYGLDMYVLHKAPRFFSLPLSNLHLPAFNQFNHFAYSHSLLQFVQSVTLLNPSCPGFRLIPRLTTYSLGKSHSYIS